MKMQLKIQQLVNEMELKIQHFDFLATLLNFQQPT